MPGFFERLEIAIGKEFAGIANFAHDHFRGRLDEHGHMGMAIIETIAEVCRNHPNIVGIAAGVLVERLLVAEKKAHEAHLAALAEEAAKTQPKAERRDRPKAPAQVRVRLKKSKRLKPMRVALEVMGALILLKIANSTTRLFHHKHHGEVWFAPVARIHVISAAIAVHALISAINDPKMSAWRNGAILFFGTDALKPLLKWYVDHPITLKAANDAALDRAAEPELGPGWTLIRPSDEDHPDPAPMDDVAPIRLP